MRMRKDCSHWLWSLKDEALLIKTDRLRAVTSRLPQSEPCPSIALIIGRRTRLKYCPKPIRHSGRLCLDIARLEGGSILLGTTSLTPRSRAILPCCRSCNKQALNQPAADATALLYSRLLHPFVDVFCFYAYKPYDLKKIATHLDLWTPDNYLMRPKNLPRLVIILHGSLWKKKNMEVWKEFSLFSSRPERLQTIFSAIDFTFETRKSPMSVEAILEKAKFVRDLNKAAGLLFSVQHVNALFERAFDGVGRPPQSFIQYARQDFQISTSLASHVAGFLSLIPKSVSLETFGAETIASALVLDSYPPAMHGKGPEYSDSHVSC